MKMNFFSTLKSKIKLSDLILDSNVEDSVKQICNEYRKKDTLNYSKKILLTSLKSGVGKVSTAIAVANELSLDIKYIHLELITSMENVCKIFEKMQKKAVYIFEDIQTLYLTCPFNVCNYLLCRLNYYNGKGLIFCTETLKIESSKSTIDMFDYVIQYSGNLTEKNIDMLLTKFLGTFKCDNLNVKYLTLVFKNFTIFDIYKICNLAVKQALVKDCKIVSAKMLINNISNYSYNDSSNVENNLLNE